MSRLNAQRIRGCEQPNHQNAQPHGCLGDNPHIARVIAHAPGKIAHAPGKIAHAPGKAAC